jgi:hypothetical protein
MSESSFSGAEEGARLAGRHTGGLEVCGIITSRVTSRVIQKAEMCGASPAQMARLRSLIEQERSFAKRDSSCGFTTPQLAEAASNKIVEQLDENIREGKCD